MFKKIFLISLGVTLFNSCEQPDYPTPYPILITNAADNISETGVRLSAKVESEALGEVTDFGFVWDDGGTPQIFISSQVSLGTQLTREFSAMATEGMVNGVTSYVRPYVLTKEGLTIYGPSVSFKSKGTATRWEKIGDAPFNDNGGVASATINGKIYSCYGNLLYVFDASSKTWAKKANFPGASRRNASAFTMNGKLYYGFGRGTGQSSEYKDLYSYDPSSDLWSFIENAPVPTRYNALAFVIGSKAYIGFGISSAGRINDFWEFDPATSGWKSIPHSLNNNPAFSRSSCFVINGKGYVVGVEYPGGSFSRALDVYEFDPVTYLFTRKADYPAPCISTYNVMSSTIGYVFTKPPVRYHNKIFGYDPVKNVWSAEEIFLGLGRDPATAAFINGKIYFGTGVSVLPVSSGGGTIFPQTKDFWQLSVR